LREKLSPKDYSRGAQTAASCVSARVAFVTAQLERRCAISGSASPPLERHSCVDCAGPSAGIGAAEEIAAAIEMVNRSAIEIDVLVVAAAAAARKICVVQ